MWVARQGARVGVAAVAVGLALAVPGVAAATTEGADTGAATATDTQTQATAPAEKSAKTTSRRGAPSAARVAEKPAAAAAGRSAARTAARTASTPASSRRANRTAATAATPVSPDNQAPATQTPVTPGQPVAAATATTSSAPADVTTVSPAAEASATPAPVAAKPVAALSITGAAATAAATDPISALFGPIQNFIEGIGLLIRRTFFNQAPVVAPVQLTGQTGGTITGTIGAVDPEGDPIIYSITDQPLHGIVNVAADGTYTYTPGAGFTGRDSFIALATDTGFHLNLLDLFRPAGTQAFAAVDQNAPQSLLTFTFNFVTGSGGQYWTQVARGALQYTAENLATNFVITTPVNITFDVTATNSPLSGTLASAGSDLTSSDPGFFDTVVQHKILTGEDTNGAEADGTIDWNFGQPWAFGNSVSYGQYDFTSTAMHELMHAFGFLSNVDEPGWDATNRTWTTFDSFMVTRNGTKVIANSDYSWNPAFNTNLTGGNGGLNFGGPNAVAVYGRPVPLYTPNPWEPGSSVSHLDDSTFVGSNSKLMNAISDTGMGIRVLSPVELAILRDIGYTVNSNPVSAAVFIIGFGFIRRRRRNR